MNYKDNYTSKILTAQSIPHIISEHIANYEVLFVTYTFKDMKRSCPTNHYHEFFKYQRQSFDNALLNNCKAYRKRPISILIPELLPSRHYHGFLLIHKETTKNFTEKCVADVDNVYCEALDKEVASIRLNDKFINPYPPSITDHHSQAQMIKSSPCRLRSAYQRAILINDQSILEIADYRLHPLHSIEEVKRVNNYCFKNAFKQNLMATDDIIFEMKAKH